MYIVSFHSIFSENAIILSKRLNIEFTQEFTPKEGDVVIVFGAHEIADKLVTIQQQINIKYIIIQTEQFYGKAFDNKYYLELLENNAVLDWSKENIKRIKKQMPNAKFYGIYFYDFFIHEELPDFDSRPIDFFFCGSNNVVRDKMLKQFKLENEDYTCEFDLSYSYMNQSELSEKLKQVKYVINLPYYKDNVLECQRIIKGLSMGCRVISMPSIDNHLNQLFKDYVYFVPTLAEFSLLIEQEPKKTYVKMIEEFGAYHIQSCMNGILNAEKKLKELMPVNEVVNGDSSV
jgi:hypothetical protein